MSFEFLRWLSGAPVKAHLQLQCRDAGGHLWSTHAPISDDLWAWLVCCCCPGVTAWGPSAVPTVGEVVKLQVAFDWAVRKGNRAEDWRLGPAAAAWDWSAGSQA